MDNYDKICRVFTRIEKRKHLSRYEVALLQTLKFYGCVSNCGRIYPYLDMMENYCWFLKEVGLIGTYDAIMRIYKIVGTWDMDCVPDVVQQRIESNLKTIEGGCEGDFVWSDPIYAHIQMNRKMYPHIKDEDVG